MHVENNQRQKNPYRNYVKRTNYRWNAKKLNRIIIHQKIKAKKIRNDFLNSCSCLSIHSDSYTHNLEDPITQISNDPSKQIFKNSNKSNIINMYNYYRQPEEWKDIPPEKRIEKLRKGIKIHGMKFNNERQLSMLDKRQKLVNIGIQRPLNSMQHIRLMDGSFPLDRSFLKNPNYFFKIFYNSLNFKKVIKLIHHKDLKIWEYFFEEKFPDSIDVKGLKSVEYYIQWLFSMGDASCYQMGILIRKYLDNRIAKLEEQKQLDEMVSEDESSIPYLQYLNKQSTQSPEVQLPENVRNYINKNPWIKRISCSDSAQKEGSLRSIQMNEKYVEITGSKPSISGLYDQSENPLAKMILHDWVSAIIMFFYCSLGKFSGPISRHCCQLIDEKENIIPGFASIYKESWYIDGILWYSFIISFTLDS